MDTSPQTAGFGQGGRSYSFEQIGDEFDSRLTPGIPAALSQGGFDVSAPEPLDQESIARLREWLAAAPKIRAPGWSSYGLKHIAEKALGRYVANGDLIAACILEGFIVRQDPRPAGHMPRPNATIGISAPWVKRQIRESKETIRDHV
jgi:hypothetical protein